MRGFSVLPVLALALATRGASADPWFKVENSDNIQQCGPIKVSWGGGTGPYKFVAYAPLLAAVITYVDGDSGSTTITNPYPERVDKAVKNTQIMFTLEDANGVFAPASDAYLIKTGGSKNCNLTTKPEFFFGIDPAQTVKQCSPVKFTVNLDGNKNLTQFMEQPFKITIIVPGHEAWEEEYNGYDFSTTANIVKDANVLYSIRDHNDHQGGSSDLMTVVGSSDTSCLGKNTKGGKVSSGKLSGGAIAGVVIGCVVGVALIAALAWFLWRRSRRSATGGRPQEISPVDLYDATAPEPKPFKGGYAGVPGQEEAGTALSPYYGGTASESGTHPASHHPDEVSTMYGGSQGYGGHQRGFSIAESSSAGAPSTFGGHMVMSPGAMPPGAAPAPGRMSKSAVAAREPLEPTYRIQADAGRIPQPTAAPVAPVIDMPPTYNPDWQAEDDGPSAGLAPAAAGHSSSAGQNLAPETDDDFRLSSRTNQS